MNKYPVLFDRSFDKLNWSNDWLQNIHLLRFSNPIRTNGFLGAIAQGYCKSYINEKIGDMGIQRKDFINTLKKEFSYIHNIMDATSLENVSNKLNLDIYILDAKSSDLKLYGYPMEKFYKKRKSIILLQLPNNYELIGVHEKTGIKTIFNPNEEIIKIFINRYKHLRKTFFSNV